MSPSRKALPWDDMCHHVVAGEAFPLREDRRSPVLFRGDWWEIRDGAEREEYTPVRKAATVKALDAEAIERGWTPPEAPAAQSA